MEWIINNKEWLLSGIGLVFISPIIRLIIRLIRNKLKKEHTTPPVSRTDNGADNSGNSAKNIVNVHFNEIFNKDEKQNSPPPTAQVAKIELKALNKATTERYLRRRCRYSPIGSKKFREIITELTTLKVEATIKDYDSRINSLSPNFEREIANAVYNENIGNISNMLVILNSFQLQGTKESVRLLFLGIAYEKIDRIPEAKKCYMKILQTEKNRKLYKSAQFNLLLCIEKEGKEKNIDFTIFFKDNTVLLNGQRIKDKALTMHLIVCKKENRPFLFDNVLNNSLQYEIDNNPMGYVKTKLTFMDFNKSMITEEDIQEIVRISSEKSINARIAVLVKLHNRINHSDSNLRLKIKDTLNSLKDKYSNDMTIEKHIKELN
ncbi:MAG: hypothetical protein LBL58_10645 [Tannerellaceae bacterium]|jgi:tetratricopeptide (TPR) repeat protein|nr:hypothetical protein [Tannerellaceae bacterium]